jgi:hypothetical protein
MNVLGEVGVICSDAAPQKACASLSVDLLRGLGGKVGYCEIVAVKMAHLNVNIDVAWPQVRCR